MMMLLEDLRQALRQICEAMGLSGTTATVAPLVVLGVALNIAALSAVESIRSQRHPGHVQTALRSATQTELKVVRAVVVSTLKKIDDGRRRWCLAQQWIKDRQTKITGDNFEFGFVWTTPNKNEVCDVTLSRSPARKTAIAFVQC
jgi:hypothetical protein